MTRKDRRESRFRGQGGGPSEEGAQLVIPMERSRREIMVACTRVKEAVAVQREVILNRS